MKKRETAIELVEQSSKSHAPELGRLVSNQLSSVCRAAKDDRVACRGTSHSGQSVLRGTRCQENIIALAVRKTVESNVVRARGQVPSQHRGKAQRMWRENYQADCARANRSVCMWECMSGSDGGDACVVTQ